MRKKIKKDHKLHLRRAYLEIRKFNRTNKLLKNRKTLQLKFGPQLLTIICRLISEKRSLIQMLVRRKHQGKWKRHPIN